MFGADRVAMPDRLPARSRADHRLEVSSYNHQPISEWDAKPTRIGVRMPLNTSITSAGSSGELPDTVKASQPPVPPAGDPVSSTATAQSSVLKDSSVSEVIAKPSSAAEVEWSAAAGRISQCAIELCRKNCSTPHRSQRTVRGAIRLRATPHWCPGYAH